MGVSIGQKTTASDDEENWPKGSYCIYKYGNCPVGFRWGRLGFPEGATTGVVPDGSVSSDGIKVEFCCRDDGFASNPIRLPARSPFPLLRHGGECQQVDGADVRQGWIEYRGNGHRAGITPDDDGDDNSHELYYCSYSVPGSIVNIPATRVISAAMPVHTANVLGFATFVTIICVAAL
ncbi:uncharacterized protein LOC118407427 [Branchiostoma floridae]|uniref:Uncharacterized protein LOC118407427 n=1 Tax=Branchiostoma floridae TaxID=7739 RepID=A0A9J7HTH7_BRAFL|nr:uncharacterized protein LOC118407427 [Branchiostoma floridae]